MRESLARPHDALGDRASRRSTTGRTDLRAAKTREPRGDTRAQSRDSTGKGWREEARDVAREHLTPLAELTCRCGRRPTPRRARTAPTHAYLGQVHFAPPCEMRREQRALRGALLDRTPSGIAKRVDRPLTNKPPSQRSC